MKMTQGYVTLDGTFFESKLEAELFEAELKLRGQLVGMDAHLDPEKILAIVIAVMPEIWSYINAYQAIQTADRNQQAKEQEREPAEVSEALPPVEGRGYVAGTEEDLASLLKLPTRGSVHVPDVGSSPCTEEVSNRRKVDGA